MLFNLGVSWYCREVYILGGRSVQSFLDALNMYFSILAASNSSFWVPTTFLALNPPILQKVVLNGKYLSLIAPMNLICAHKSCGPDVTGLPDRMRLYTKYGAKAK